MKILLVTETIPGPQLGGLAKHVVSLGNGLIKQGHDVVLMGRDRPDYDSCAAEIGFNGRFLIGFPDPFKGWKEKSLGVFMPGKRSWYARQMAKSIVAHARDFDVIHYHGLHPMIARFIPAHVPFVQTRHDQGSDCMVHTRFYKGDVCKERSPDVCGRCAHPRPGLLRKSISSVAVRWLRKDVEKGFSRHPVIFVSQFLLDNYRKTIPKPKAIVGMVCHNFVDEERLRSIRRRGGQAVSSKQSFVVHLAGRMDGTKGIGQFLRLLAPKLPPDWQVNVFGDGPEREPLSRELHDPRIIFHGHLPYEDTISASASADCVVVPSLWEESCSTVILEALKLGVRCYALDRGGSPELLKYGAPGQLKLLNSLPEMVGSVISDSRNKIPVVDMGSGISADVVNRIPDLISAYREAILRGALHE